MYNITIFRITKELESELIEQQQTKRFPNKKFFIKLSEQLGSGCYKIIVERSPFKFREVVYKTGKVMVKEYIRGVKEFFIFC